MDLSSPFLTPVNDTGNNSESSARGAYVSEACDRSIRHSHSLGGLSFLLWKKNMGDREELGLGPNGLNRNKFACSILVTFLFTRTTSIKARQREWLWPSS